MSARLRINPIACEGHGVCVELLPELLRLDDWGYPIVDQVRVDDALRQHARRAANCCPTLAFVIEDDGT